MVAYHGCSWLTVAKSMYKHNKQGCTKDSPILIEWLIHSIATYHYAMRWTLIIASFEAQSIRMLSSETANENNCGEKGRTDQEIS
jgi:hypothetical protein